MNAPAKIGLMGARFGANNMGVGALTYGVLKCIRHKIPDAKVFFFDYGKAPENFVVRTEEGKLSVPLVNIRFSKSIYLANNIAYLLGLALIYGIIPFKKTRDRLFSANPYLRELYTADVVASIAGGDSFSDIYGIRRFLYVALPQILALWVGKPLALLPQTIGPFEGVVPRVIARYILRRAKIVFARDRDSFAEATKLLEGDAGHIRFCEDVGFVVDAIRPERFDQDEMFKRNEDRKLTVGLNVSGLLYRGGYTRDNMFGLKMDYTTLVRRIIEYFLEKEQVELILVPHVFGGFEDMESDQTVCAEIYDALKDRYGNSLSLAQGRYNQNEIKYVIGRCNFFVGSRMHACIAALSQHVPAVAVAYSRKFRGVYEALELEYLVADPRMLEERDVIEKIDWAYNNRLEIREKLEAIMPEVKSRVLNLFDRINPQKAT